GLLTTGYELHTPFLSSIRNTSLSTPLLDQDDCAALTSNGRHLRPLFRHVWSLAPTHAPRALAFLGLPTFVENGSRSRQPSTHRALHFAARRRRRVS
ncbi:hypothetical protein EDB86DRAFT_2885507, partial [Lactarius hatsudake]